MKIWGRACGWGRVLAAVSVAGAMWGVGGGDASGALYHVSASGGSDGNDGCSEARPWRGLERVNAAVLRPGDSVLFRRGEEWRGQLVPRSGEPGAPVTYGAYGSGAKPRLLGSVSAADPAFWEAVGGGVWATAPARFVAVGERVDLGVARWQLHREGGARARLVAESGAGGYRIECGASGERSNEIQFFGGPLAVRSGEWLIFRFEARSDRPLVLTRIGLGKGVNPWTRYAEAWEKGVEIGVEWGRHEVHFRGVEDGVDGRLTMHLGGGLPAGATLWVRPGRLEEARCEGGLGLDVDVGNIIFDGGPACGVKRWRREDLKGAGEYWYDGVGRRVFLRAEGNPGGGGRGIELALRRHIISEGGCHDVVYRDLDLRYGAAHGIGGGGVRGIVVRGCDISYIGGGHQFTRPDGKPVRFGNGIEFWGGARDCVVEGCRLWEIYDAALTNQGRGADSVQRGIVYRDNVIWNCEYSFEYWNGPAAARTEEVVFEHNTCADAGCGWGHGQRPDRNGRHLMFYHNAARTRGVRVTDNIFCESAESGMRMENDWREALESDRNLWWESEGPLFRYLRVEYGAERLEEYRALTGLERRSAVARPRFADVGARDYRLVPGSPGFAGLALGGVCGARPGSP